MAAPVVFLLVVAFLLASLVVVRWHSGVVDAAAAQALLRL